VTLEHTTACEFMSSGRAGSSVYVNMKLAVQFFMEFYGKAFSGSRIVT
jgi:hypothetical protein